LSQKLESIDSLVPFAKASNLPHPGQPGEACGGSVARTQLEYGTADMFVRLARLDRVITPIGRRKFRFESIAVWFRADRPSSRLEH
jgi:hypothetical protein